MIQTRLNGEIVSEIVFYCRNDGLHEFEKNYEVQVHLQLPSSFRDGLTNSFHGLGMPAKKTLKFIH